MKKAFIFIILLMLLLSAAVFWQWSNYHSESNEQDGNTEAEITQEVDVTIAQGGIRIKQIYRGIENGKLNIMSVPKLAENIRCTDMSSNPCEEESSPRYYKVAGNELQFDYFIKTNLKNDYVLIEDWLVLPEGAAGKTRIEIVDKLRLGGTWIAGLPLKGSKKAEMVDYYVFEGKGNGTSLYWQKKELTQFSTQDGISYFSPSKEKAPAVGIFEKLAHFGNQSHVSVVFKEDGLHGAGNGIIFVNKTLPKRELETRIAQAFLSMKFHGISAKEQWLIEALAALVTDTEPEHPKSQSLIMELAGKLSQSEKNEFRSALSSHETLNHDVLNRQLASIRGMRTDFFTLNRHEESRLHPLIFLDGRKVSANDKRIKDLHIALDGDTRLYPFGTTLEALGYQVKWDREKQFVKVENERNTYNFNLKNNTFEGNKEQFGLLENPFRIINGGMYVEEHWLSAIFNISIRETDREIHLSLNR